MSHSILSSFINFYAHTLHINRQMVIFDSGIHYFSTLEINVVHSIIIQYVNRM